MNGRLFAVTLMELLIAIALLSVIVIGFASIDLFSRFQMVSTERRAKLQNEVTYTLEHLTKAMGKAVGNRQAAGQDPIRITPNTAIRINIDTDGNSQADTWIAYRFFRDTNPQDYQICYCSPCPDSNCDTCPAGWEVIAQRISEFIPTDDSPPGNYVNVRLTACWDPDGSPEACGTTGNPNVTMNTRIKAPSVSTN